MSGASTPTAGPSNPAPQNEQQAIQTVLQALNTLYTDPDNQAKANANTWLQEFQKTPEAWQTANALLLSSDLPVEPRLFAAQTFRTKITFDMDQVPPSARAQLRDTLLHALTLYTSGPRVIQTQISLSLSALALQMPESDWPRVVPSMIEKFGGSAETVGTLLEFLTVLPEEVITNHRIAIDNEQYHIRVQSLLSEPAPDILKTLSMYIQAPGITPQIQTSLFQCLRSWLKSGEIAARQMVETPLFQLSFDALASENLFDVAVDVLCDLINETQEVEENMDVIQLILPRIIPLRAELAKAGDDEDKVRGLCRIFVQAGEAYYRLVLRHKDEFFPVVQAIAECASYHDLDIVQITFRFWYLLAGPLEQARDDPGVGPFLGIYEQLLSIIVRHLRFPDDPDTLTGQERDDFRSFRHYMGDTLKDCCQVLGSKQCLSKSLDMIQTTLAASSLEALKWQDVEAPLFSMRAMGAQADPRDDEIIPKIIDIIPKLPDHPKLKYAGLLVLSRYTEWIDMHPDRIPDQLSYISAGLDHNTSEVSAAAAQAMNFLCQDCRRHLVPFLPQLYDFFKSINDKLGPDDLMAVSEGVAHVIAGMPPQDAPEPLMHFSQPLLETLAQVAAMPQPEKEDLRRAADRMEQLEKFLMVVGAGFWQHLPATCARTCQEAYSVIDTVLASHGHIYFISERACALLRRGLGFFGKLTLPSLPALLERLAICYEATGFPGYIWIAGKCIDQFGRGADLTLRSALQGTFDRISGKTMKMLEESTPSDLSDVIDDYVHTCVATAGNTPSLLYLSPVFPHAFRTALSALTLYKNEIIEVALEFIREVVGHDALSLPPSASQPGTPLPAELTSAANPQQGPSLEEMAAYAASIRQVVGQQGYQLVTLLLTGLVTHFSPDTMPVVVVVLRVLSGGFPSEMAAWIGPAAEQLPTSNVPANDKAQFVERYMSALNARNLDQVKQALNGLYNASRKARERARMDRGGDLLGR
ncbi:Nuclear import receptor [Thecaphora frezii]